MLVPEGMYINSHLHQKIHTSALAHTQVELSRTQTRQRKHTPQSSILYQHILAEDEAGTKCKQEPSTKRREMTPVDR